MNKQNKAIFLAHLTRNFLFQGQEPCSQGVCIYFTSVHENWQLIPSLRGI